LVWSLLPIPTMPVIWVRACRASPLPIITTATGTGHYRLL
jgi:hypothetical protein